MAITDRPGGGRLVPATWRRASVVVLAAAGLASALAACGPDAGAAGPVSPSPSPSVEESYGALPSFLPTDAAPVHRVLTGTEADPALSVEGDQVKVQLPGASVLAVVTGPEVPGEGLPNAPETTTCTWTVTLSKATAPVSIAVSDFSTLDHLGNVNQPQLVSGQPTPPATLEPGRTVRFELRATMVVGEGIIRWAPGQHHRTTASWDFEVEND